MLPDPGAGPVGFYVHHHGSGHATRSKQLADGLPADTPVRFFTSAPDYFEGYGADRLTPLPPDFLRTRDPARDLLRDNVLHYAPVDLPGVSARMAIIAGWIAEHRPAYFVVDLSVELALFVRLCGCRVYLVRLHGHRDDPAHTAAFQLAEGLLAPFAPALEDAHTPDWVREKTIYLGTFSRYDNRKEARPQVRRTLKISGERPVVTVVNGSGGATRSAAYWAKVAAAHPDQQWLLVGRLDAADVPPPDNLRLAGFVADTYPYLRAADYLIGSGGTNTMSEVAAVRGRFISLPEPRPFGEQVCKMRALERLGLTVVVEALPAAGEWREYLAKADELDLSRWEAVTCGSGSSVR